MPFYRNRCTTCGHEFEEFASVNAPAPICVIAGCPGETVHVPQIVGPPQGGPTPRFYRGWSH
jgi:hypothetical protein